MSTVPKAVRKQAEQAEKMLKEQNDGIQDTANKALNSDGEESKQAKSDQQQPNPGQEQAPEQGNAASEDEYRKLQAAHSALQGKYNAEVPRLNQQIRDLQQQLQQAQEQTKKAEKQTEQAKAQLDEKLSSIRDEYGDDLADTLSAVAQSASMQDSRGESEKDQQARFERAILRAMPDFMEMNSSQEWHSWLAQVPDGSNRSYQDALNEAAKDRDSNGVLRLARAFRKSQKQSSKQDPVESQLAAPRSTQASQPGESQQYTAADLAKLARDVARGKYVGRETVANNLQDEINAALIQQQQQL